MAGQLVTHGAIRARYRATVLDPDAHRGLLPGKQAVCDGVPAVNQQMSGRTIDGLVEQQAAVRPGAAAVVYLGQVTTYAELDDQAHDWQADLHLMGVRPGDVVTVRLPREPRLVAVLLGLLRCGAAYLAADPSWPEDRIRSALEVTAGAFLVDEADGACDVSAPVLRAGREPAHRGRPASRSHAAGAASVFLTSGSSGRPKAVLSTHRGAVHVLEGQAFADLGPGRRMLQAAPLPWDGLTLELWGPLLNGGTAVLAGDDVDIARRLRRHVMDDGVDTVWLTASVFHALVDDDPASFSGLTQVMTGGERVSPDHVHRFRAQHPAVALTNGYGPCETTVFVTTHLVGASGDLVEAPGEEISLGRPLRGVRLVGPSGAAVEEIVVGGPGLALGYLGDARSTASAFVPAAGGQRVYRTGDLGSLDGSGRLRFHGRVDRQLKVRGQRVEPQDVEELVRSALPVTAVAVTAARGSTGEAVGLVAHVVPRDRPRGSDVDHLQRAWTSLLSDAAASKQAYLRPQRLVVHDQLPRLPNGKLDYAELESEVDRRTEVDTGLTGTCRRLLDETADLGVAAGADEDLLAAGLDSLTLIRLLARVHGRGPRFIEPVDVYRLRTARALSQLWDERQGTSSGREARGSGVRRAVQDMWLHEQLHPGDESALVVSVHRVGPDFDVAAWRTAVAAVAHRHSALGSVLDFDDDVLRRSAASGGQLEALKRGEPWPDGCTVLGAEATIAPGSLRPFDLENALPWRWHLSGSDGGYLLMLVLHHVAVDGWSEAILIADLGRAYRGAALGPATPPGLPAASPPRRAFWSRSVRGAAVPVLPAAAPGASAGPPRTFVLETEALDSRYGPGALAWQSGLLVALEAALRRLGAVSDGLEPLVGVAYSGRDDGSADEVGLLVDLLPVALAPDALEVETRWLSAVENRHSLDLSEVARLAGRRGQVGRTPFPVGFALQSRARPRLDLGQCSAVEVSVQLTVPPFDVYVEVWPQPEGLRVLVYHNVARVEHGWVVQLTKALEEAARAEPE